MGLGEHFQLRSQRSLEPAAILGTAAGGDGGDVLMGFKKTMDLGKRGQRLLQVAIMGLNNEDEARAQLQQKLADMIVLKG